jgi:hypothetical protein
MLPIKDILGATEDIKKELIHGWDQTEYIFYTSTYIQ